MNFRKIIQFRKALEKFKDSKKKFSLTDVSLISEYYDHPAFNNAFKKLTGEKPSSFFKNTDSFTKKEIYFKNVQKR